jgi:acetyl-CoA synthetase
VQTAKEEGQHVDKVMVWRRHADKYLSQTKMVDGRDFFTQDLLKKYAGRKIEPEQMDATDPLFIRAPVSPVRTGEIVNRWPGTWWTPVQSR